MKNSLTVDTTFGSYPNCHISINRYQYDGSVCIDIWNNEEGAIARLTTCLSDKSLMKTNCSYLDENNCPWGLEFIEKYGLGKDTGRIRPSGYCIYPLIEWDMEALEKYS